MGKADVITRNGGKTEKRAKERHILNEPFHRFGGAKYS